MKTVAHCLKTLAMYTKRKGRRRRATSSVCAIIAAGAGLAFALQPRDGAAGEARWAFAEVILDPAPLANNRINDLAIGDLNADGLLDVWVSGRNGSGHQAAWYRNPGDRTVAWERFTILEGSWKYGALGDVDGDSDLDIVAGFDDESRVYWIENDGTPEDGGWTKHNLGLAGKPDQIFVRDLDGDGPVEIIAYYKGGPLALLRRPEDPRAEWIETTIAGVPSGTAGGSIGDVDDDGDLDLVFGNRWYENPLPDRDWHLGEYWVARIIDRDWTEEARSAVADIDGDGRTDIVMTGEEDDSGVAWYRNESPRSGGAWTRTVVNRTPYEKLHTCQVADFNGDGKPDIFVAEMHTSDTQRLTIFEQGVTPQEWTERVIATVGAHNAKVADLDGDRRPDLATKNFEQDMRPRIWFNTLADRLPLDRWRRHVVEEELSHKAVFVRVGDLNGDGLPDLAAGAWWWPNPGTIGGNWRRQTLGGDLENVAVLYDFTGDGTLDILGTTGEMSSAFVWARNDGTGKFTVHRVGPDAKGDFLQGAAVGELLANGTQVVLSWHNGYRTKPVHGTQWYRVPGSPEEPWVWEQVHPFSNEEGIALGDIDGDGDLDIHLGTKWLRNDSAGRFTLIDALSLTDGEPDRVRLADIDANGDLDVVVGAEHARRLVWGENPGGDGTGPWREHLIAEDFNHMSLDVGDLDRDGDPDVVSGAHKGRGKVNVYENLGRGESWQRHVVDAGAPGLDHHDGTILADLDGDGDLDIASVGWKPVSLVIYENLALTWGGWGGARRDAQPAEEQARTSFWDYLLNW